MHVQEAKAQVLEYIFDDMTPSVQGAEGVDVSEFI